MKITGDWLAGFIDGEGSFNISYHGVNFQPRFNLKLRDYDSAILKDIRDFIGAGTLHNHKYNPVGSIYYSPKTRNQYRLDITGRDNIKLIAILDNYSLRSKRAIEIYSKSLFNRCSNLELKKLRNDQLLALKIELENTRRYHEEV